MNRRQFLQASAATCSAALLPTYGFAQQASESSAPKKAQAKAPKTQPFGPEAFKPEKRTTLRWLGGAGFLVNARGTTLMIDPVLEGFDMKVMIEEPILPAQVPQHADLQGPGWRLQALRLNTLCGIGHAAGPPTWDRP